MRRSYLLLVVLAGLVLGELVARYGLNLTPPLLSEFHPTIEYRLRANLDVRRDGNLIRTNERGMRSPSLEGEGRRLVLVVGDSIVNGGVHTDQAALATSRLTDGTWLYANLSANSWGPVNERAALEANSDLSPEAIILVLNDADLYDLPTYNGLHRPWLATLEGARRLMVRLVPGLAPRVVPPTAEQQVAGPASLRSLLQTLQTGRTPACVVLHATRDMVLNRTGMESPVADYEGVRDIVAASGLPWVETEEEFRSALERGEPVFRDNYHPSATGQEVLAQSFRGCVAKLTLT